MPQRRYLAHIQLRPRDGSPTVVVETEFKAAGYPNAWQHVLEVGRKFNATIMSHKLVEVDEDGVLDGSVTVIPNVSQQNADEMPKPTLTVKETSLDDWYGECINGTPKPIPFPYPKEDDSNDSAAA